MAYERDGKESEPTDTSERFSRIPINRGTKTPSISSWKEYQSRKPTAEEIQKWTDSLQPEAWAYILGAVSGNIYVVDVDSLIAEKTVIGRWMKHLGPTLTVATSGYDPADPESGKRHFYFHDDTVPLKRQKFGFEQFTQDARVPHIDLQGEGSYVLAPGSKHPSGGIYTIVDNAPIKDVSYELVSKILNILKKHWLLLEKILPRYAIGSRHEYSLALGGYCYHHGFSLDEALILGRALGYGAVPDSNEDDIKKIEANIKVTYDRANGGVQVGYREAWGDELVEEIDSLQNRVKFSQSDAEREAEKFRQRFNIPEGGLVPISVPKVVGQSVVTTLTDEEEDAMEAGPTAIQLYPNETIEQWYMNGFQKRIDPMQFPQTDSGNAEQMFARFGEYIRWVPEMGFVTWNGKRWEVDLGETTVTRLAKLSARLMGRDISTAATTKELARMQHWALRSESASGIAATIKMLRSEVKAGINDFDRDPWLLNVMNGTIDLRSGQRKDHEMRDMITMLAPISYDSTADCPRWLQFQEEIEPDGEVRAWKKTYFGYSLTGDTRERMFGIAHGESGDNGKSTEKELLLSLMGDYGAATTFAVLAADATDDRIRNELARLKGKRFVVASESSEKMVLHEAVIKEITGRDTIRARFLYKTAFEYVPTFKMWLITNVEPIIKATTNSIWNRTRKVPYLQTFTPDRQDKLLGQKLKDETSGILN